VSALVLFALLMVALGPGCSVTTNTTAVQCTSTAECVSKGPGFEGTTCDAVTKTCLKAEDTAGLCNTNQECIDRNGGAPSICRKSDKKCVVLTSPECPSVLTRQGNTEIANDNTIVIGAITPVNTIELGTVMEQVIALAQQEISAQSFLRGLPPVPGSSASRPMVVVACREFGAGIEGLLRAANHLARNVQVPLVIGPVDPGNGGIVASQVFLPNKILEILPTAVISDLANIPNPIAPTPLIWRLIYDDRSVSTVASAFLTNYLEPLLRSKLPADEKIRVAVVYEGNLLGKSTQAQLVSRIRWNRKPSGDPMNAAENAVENNYLITNYGDLNDPVSNPNPDGLVGQVIAQLVQFRPHIIFHAYSVFGIQRVMFGYEQRLAQNPGSAPQPYHIGLTPPWNAFVPLFNFADAQPFRTGRLFAVQGFTSPQTPPFPPTSNEVTGWFARLGEKFPELKTSQTPLNQLVWLLYDATYTAAYAITALRDKPVTGENLAGTLGQFLPPGELVTTYGDPTQQLTKGFAELTAGRNIDLQGLSGPLNFDLTTGAPITSTEISCPNISAQTGRTIGMKGSGFRFNVRAQLPVITGADGVDNPPTGALLGCPPPPP